MMTAKSPTTITRALYNHRHLYYLFADRCTNESGMTSFFVLDLDLLTLYVLLKLRLRGPASTDTKNITKHSVELICVLHMRCHT